MDLKTRYERIKTKTIQVFEEQPVAAIAAAAALLAAGAKLMDANTRRKNSKTWKDEVERRKMLGY
jgi:hypothetical protein